MKMGLGASSARKWMTFVSASCVAGMFLYGCATDNDDVPFSPILTSEAPDQVAVAPTLAPVQPNTTTPITSPNFPQITPPPITPDLPDQPQIGTFSATQDFASLSYRVDITGIRARGVIQSVRLQALNITCGTDVTDAIRPSALAQFQNVLIGRGNTFTDALDPDGFDLSFTFPTDPRFFDDLRILFKAVRAIPVVDEEGEISLEDELTGDDVVLVLVIEDSFGQVVRVDDSIFNDGEERFETRGGAIPECGNIPQPTPTPTPTPPPPVIVPDPEPPVFAAAPVFDLGADPNPVIIGNEARLRFVIDNRVTNAEVLRELNFNSVLPEGLLIADNPDITFVNQFGRQCEGIFGGTPRSRVITLDRALIQPDEVCTASIDVRVFASGSPQVLTLPETVLGSAIEQIRPVVSLPVDLIVNPAVPGPTPTPEASRPSFDAQFSPNPTRVGVRSTLEFRIDNTAPDAVRLTGVGFDNVLLNGPFVADPPEIEIICNGSVGQSSLGGGVFGAVPNTRILSLDRAVLEAGQTCILRADVVLLPGTVPVPGTYGIPDVTLRSDQTLPVVIPPTDLVVNP